MCLQNFNEVENKTPLNEAITHTNYPSTFSKRNIRMFCVKIFVIFVTLFAFGSLEPRKYLIETENKNDNNRANAEAYRQLVKNVNRLKISPHKNIFVV